MIYDPFQTYQVPGTAQALNNPFGNPLAAISPFSQMNAGIHGLYPQQVPYAGLAPQTAIPQQLFGQPQPWFGQPQLQTPYGAGLQNNPLLAGNPFLQLLLAQQQMGVPQQLQFPQAGSIGTPYGQFGQQAHPQAFPPQTALGSGMWFGAGQVNPLISQLAQRAYQTAGISPWACF